MSFNLYTSNKLEKLADRLSCILREPLPDPFIKEIIVVQSGGMERWLRYELAGQLNICANFEFPFLNAFFKKIFASLFGNRENKDLFNPDILTWRIMDIISDEKSISSDDFESVRNYICGANPELRRFQLSEKIAHVFDQYQIYRPEMILKWNQNLDWPPLSSKPDYRWQKKLWGELVSKQDPAVLDRVSLFQKFREKIESGIQPDSLIRVSVFGISSIPPVYLHLLKLIGRNTDVHFFYLNPCKVDWEFALAEKEKLDIAEKFVAKEIPDEFQHFDEHNPLLASLGRHGREFLTCLTGAADYSPDPEDFTDPGENSMLHCVQHDILLSEKRNFNSSIKNDFPENDKSIRIHCCHSPMRELEVLHDSLLGFFSGDRNLKPKDIIVMAPDISIYAPLIENVFKAGEKKSGSYIPYSIADRTAPQTSSIINTFLEILSLRKSRLEASRLFDIFETEAIHKAFGVEENEVETIKKLVGESGIRWGKDAEHRNSLGAGSFEENSWNFGFKRLLLGYALPCDEKNSLFSGILPFDKIEGSAAVIFGKFMKFAECVFSLKENLETPKKISGWTAYFTTVIDNFYYSDKNSYPDIVFLKKTIKEMAENAEAAGFDRLIDSDLVSFYLKQRLNNEISGSGFLNGKVTFCSLQPMRSIPHKVVCILGMNNDDFPRQVKNLSFDLIAVKPCLCDRNRRTDDKYLFLEAILAADKHLHISYIGRDIRDGSIKPPSVAVCELRDYLADSFGLRGKSGKNSEDLKMVDIVHRLQPFSFEYFRKDGKLKTFSSENFEAAKELLKNLRFGEKIPESQFFGNSSGDFQIEPPDDMEGFKSLEIDELCRFYSSPAEYLLKRRLKIYFTGQSEEIQPDKEPFKIDSLESYQINQSILEHMKKEKLSDELFDELRAQGVLPVGAFGKAVYNESVSGVSDFLEKCKSLISGKKQTSLDARLAIDGFQLSGRLDDIFGESQIFFRYANLKCKDVMKAFISHLVLSSSVSGNFETIYIANNGKIHIPANAIENPREILRMLLKHYWNGLCGPLCFIPEMSYKFEREKVKGNVEKGFDEAQIAWNGWKNYQDLTWIKGEKEKLVNKLCFGENFAVRLRENTKFIETADEILGTVMKFIENQWKIWKKTE